ncbi:MAG: glycine--tRNA ligase subunit beta [Acidobacteria bacterium RIFCSPLOWO2_02_FULL_68_18]|nr:MAG: glycine--tRNA ligase subunit beta [Acidobacteria bacterium RIFCSPLOWO2_02_FULL_68_18]OFW49507.1 MAG: glycine--tRNA ligase subunit beta [Acidobacteria bacterium RIFCSPLOWO2_12_FULL_68_19]
MDRELLVEIGCEELPAHWLPALTAQLARQLDLRLKEFRLTTGGPAESYSTPRRLTARVAKLAERQTDLEDLVTGPPVTAAYAADGAPTPAALGFARKYGVEVAALEQHVTPKGAYLAHRVRQRGKATVDVLADVMTALLRDLTVPKPMRWDAFLDDGRGELLFARPIRWLVLMYGGRVVPFVIRRSELAEGPNVQEIRSGSHTYGHRFQTTSGRAGRAIKIKTFDDYQVRLLENFVILDRSERESRIRRELEAHARRLSGRVSLSTSLKAGGLLAAHSSLLQEVPDLVEYPSVVAGHFPPEYLQLPDEVLTTTMIHHQHFFPVVDEEGKLKSAFLAVINLQPERPEIIARNSERVLAARLRDARFFWDDDRTRTLESRIDRLSTILFHGKLGSYREKVERVSSLARWIAKEALGQPDSVAEQAARAGRLSKADLATEMVRELTELQGTMGGIYAREEGLPESIWKAIYFHYLPIGVEADAPPARGQLGQAAITWAAVSLADKLDSLAGMFSAGERPTGSRDPLGLRRQAQGAVKVLTDLPEITGLTARLRIGPLLARASEPFGATGRAASLDDIGKAPSDDHGGLMSFMADRLTYLLEQRGYDVRNVRAVLHGGIERVSPLEARLKLEALAHMSAADATHASPLHGVAALLKRVKNITKGTTDAGGWTAIRGRLVEPAEQALWSEIDRRAAGIRAAASRGDFREAFASIVALEPAVAKFFDDVLVMAEDEGLRRARLALVAALRDLILDIADLSEMATEG